MADKPQLIKKQNESTRCIIAISLSEYLRDEADAPWDCPSWESGAGRTFEPHSDAVSAW